MSAWACLVLYLSIVRVTWAMFTFGSKEAQADCAFYAVLSMLLPLSILLGNTGRPAFMHKLLERARCFNGWPELVEGPDAVKNGGPQQPSSTPS